jgi:hypothetical protein
MGLIGDRIGGLLKQIAIAPSQERPKLTTGMKYLFSSDNSARTGLIQSALDAAGIEIELRNQAVSQAEIGIPFQMELWVLRDEDYETARDVVDSMTSECSTV